MNKKQAITALESLEKNLEGLKAFCPTGPGGGIDNSCGRGGGSSSGDGSSQDDGSDMEPAYYQGIEPFLLSYAGTDFVDVGDGEQFVDVYDFGDDEGMLDDFLDKIGGAPHPNGGNRAVIERPE